MLQFEGYPWQNNCLHIVLCFVIVPQTGDEKNTTPTAVFVSVGNTSEETAWFGDVLRMRPITLWHFPFHSALFDPCVTQFFLVKYSHNYLDFIRASSISEWNHRSCRLVMFLVKLYSFHICLFTVPVRHTDSIIEQF